jgi:hypothetical protein
MDVQEQNVRSRRQKETFGAVSREGMLQGFVVFVRVLGTFMRMRFFPATMIRMKKPGRHRCRYTGMAWYCRVE